MTKTKRVGFAILAVVLGTFVSLVIAELITRVLPLQTNREWELGPYALDPKLPFKLKPSARFSGRTDEFTFDYRHNSFGFRDIEHSLAKPEGTFRIFGMGDSFTYGAGVTFEETYLYRLEQMLNGRSGAHPKIEIIKAGTSRYFPEAERMLLESYGVEYHPDLIVVCFLPNDVRDTQKGIHSVTVGRWGHLLTRDAESLGPLAEYIYRYSRFGRLLLKAYVDSAEQRRYPKRPEELSETGGYAEEDWAKVEAEYDKMLAIANSIGARLLILHLPQKGPWNERSRYPAKRLAAWAERSGADYLDLLPAMERASARERLYYEKDGHTTPAGHAVMAEELYQYLISRELIP